MSRQGNALVFDWARSHDGCCSVERFEEGGCKAVLPRPGIDWICLSGTSYQKSHSHFGPLCDLLFFRRTVSPGRQIVTVAELKGGRVDVIKVGWQLQGAAEIVEGAVGTSIRVEFVPVLIHRRLATVEINRLRTVTVRFQGERYKVRRARCGVALASVQP